jgi:glycosyltransferase involved in cell wall biosynthesis
MIMKKITFVLPSRNNLEFLKLAYYNLKKLSIGFHKILVLDDDSKDGTK